jgi:phosphoserine phosphatase
VAALHVFDLDGTLLTGSSACLEVARQLGTTAELARLEASFGAGDIDTRGFAVAIYQQWRDLTEPQVAAAFVASPWLAGIRRVCADIRRRGERSAVVTMSPDFFARHLVGLGFDTVTASRFPALPLRAALDPAAILTPADKVRIVASLRESYELPVARCVAYGDSMSDAPLFRYLDKTVAVNADQHLADLAARHYRGSDLTGAYRLARTLLAQSDSQ